MLPITQNLAIPHDIGIFRFERAGANLLLLPYRQGVPLRIEETVPFRYGDILKGSASRIGVALITVSRVPSRVVRRSKPERSRSTAAAVARFLRSPPRAHLVVYIMGMERIPLNDHS